VRSLSHFAGKQTRSTDGFTFVEVCISIVICLVFGAAAFATNQRLLVELKNQKETTAATMMLQERMEAFRSFAYTDIATATYINTNVIAKPTTSENSLKGLNETITITGHLLSSSGTASAHGNTWIRNSTYPTGSQTDTNTTLATDYDLIKVNIQLSWTSANGRVRYREISSVFGKGNIGS
jgi:type II secretory pathway pseudopilin PulG